MNENQLKINVTKFVKNEDETLSIMDKRNNSTKINVTKFVQSKEKVPVENIEEIVFNLSNQIENLEGYNVQGSLPQRTFNPGAMAYSSWMNEYGAKKGPKFPSIDNPEGRELYTAIFPNAKSGRNALEKRVKDLYQKTNGDLERFASIYALGFEPNQLIEDRQHKIKNRYFKTFSSVITKDGLNETIKRKENDISSAVVEETNRIKNSNNVYSNSLLDYDIFNPTKTKFNNQAFNEMQQPDSSIADVELQRKFDKFYNKNPKSLQEKVDVVSLNFIKDLDKDIKVFPVESYVKNVSKKIQLGDDTSVIANRKWTKYFSDAIGEEPNLKNFKGLASSWMRDVGQVVIGQLDFINKANKAFNSPVPFSVSRIDASGKVYTNQEEFAELFVSTLTAMPDVANKIYLGTKTTSDPQYATEEARESREFILQNPVSVALFGFGLKSMIPVKGFPKPKGNPQLIKFMDESTKIIETANEIKKGNILPEDVAPSVAKIADFIKHPDIIDATLKRSLQTIYDPKKTKTVSSKELSIAKNELPELLKNYADNEIKLLTQNLTEQQKLSFNQSKESLGNLISEQILKVGTENTITYLEGSTGIPKALVKKAIDAIKKIKSGDLKAKIPDEFLNLISRKTPIKQAKDIDKNYSPEYRKSQIELEKNNAKLLEAKSKNKESFLKETKKTIAEQINPRYRATSILDKLKKTYKNDKDLNYAIREVENRLIVANGATHAAKNKLTQINKNIYEKLNQQEINLLDEAIIYKANISLYDYNNSIKIPQLKKDFINAKTKVEKNKIQKEIKQRENYNYTGGKETTSKEVFKEWELDKIGNNVDLKNKINDLSDMYFDTFRAINDYKRKNGLLTDDQYTALNLRDYEPTKYLEFLEDSYKVQDSSGRTISYKNNKDVSSLAGGISDDLTRITDSHALIGQALLGAENQVFRNNAVKALGGLLDDINQINPEFAITKIGKRVASNNIKVKKGYQRISYKDFENVDGKINGGKEYFIDLDSEFAKGWTQTGGISTQGLLFRFYEAASLVRVRKFFSTNTDWAFAMKDNVRNIQYAILRQHDAYSNFLPKAYWDLSTDIIKNFPDVWKNQGDVLRYVEHGGGMEYLAQQGSYRGNLFAENPKGVRAKFRKFTDIMSHLNTTTEIASRVSIMKKLEKQGFSTLEAVAKARDIIDFSVKGDAMKLLEPISPYSGSGIRATYGLVKGFQENPRIATLKYAQTGAISASIYYLFNRNTDSKKDYYDNDVSEYDKFNNYVFVSPFELYDDLGKKRRIHFKIPKDNGAKIIGALTETAFEIADGKEFSPFRKKRL